MTSTIIVLAVLSAYATSPRVPSSGDKPSLGTRRRSRGGHPPRIKGNENHSPQLKEHAVCMGKLGAELGSEEQVASGEVRKVL